MFGDDEADITSFLQSLVTADIRQLQHRSPLYAMMLNARGRVLLDLLVYRGSQQLFLETDATLACRLRSLLKIYLVRKRIAVEDVSGNVAVAFHSDHQESFKERLRNAGCRVVASGQDPRSCLLGQRILMSMPESPDECLLDDAVQYHALRMAAGVAEGSAEIPYGACTPLEYNGDYSGAVSFEKGCYIGQELTARTYHTGVVRKRVMPIVWQRQEPASPSAVFGSVVRDSSGKSVGKLVVSVGARGLALLNVERAMASADLSAEVGGEQLALKAHRASWWPS